MSNPNRNPNRAPLRSLVQDLQALGLTHPPKPPGQEHVIREDSHLNGGSFGLRVRFEANTFYVYTWKPQVSVQTVGMTREEALKLAALINKTWPLDAMGQV